MLFEGFILGTMTAIGMALIFNKLSPNIKMWVAHHPIIAETLMVLGFYGLMGMSVTAHVAVAFMVLEAQMALHVHKNREDFLWIHAGIEKAKESLGGIKNALHKINEQYKINHAPVIDVTPGV